jgi:hypothetical protein
MALRKRGKWWYADSQADIPVELARVGELNEYVPTQFADARCTCGSNTFRLRLDDAAGAAERTCVATGCGKAHAIGDSADYLAEAELEDSQCVCGGTEFEITVGVALYQGSDDVKWLYVGCRCPACGLTGCYGDWKNEFEDYRALLARV